MIEGVRVMNENSEIFGKFRIFPWSNPLKRDFERIKCSKIGLFLWTDMPDGQTDKQTERQTDRQTGKQTNRHAVSNTSSR